MVSMRIWSLLLLLTLVTGALAVPAMFSKCCYYVAIRNCSGNNRVEHLCPDCTEPTPFCGQGRCNIFGCNCDGCRAQKEGTKILGMASWISEHL